MYIICDSFSWLTDVFYSEGTYIPYIIKASFKTKNPPVNIVHAVIGGMFVIIIPVIYVCISDTFGL